MIDSTTPANPERKTRRPPISVVIPVYNRCVDLVQAVESTLLQTLPPHEVIIVDDASSDGSYERALELARLHPHIKALRHATNEGGSAARNTGWRAATGELIAFLDSDDVWYPHKLERQVEVIERDPAFGFVFCGYAAVEPTGRIVYVRRAPPTAQWERFRFELACCNAVGTTSVAMVKKDILDQSGGFDPAFPSCQDWELWYRLAKICRFASVTEPLVEYRQSSEGRISTSRQKVMVGLEMMLGRIRQDYGPYPPRKLTARHLAVAGDLENHFHMRKSAAKYYMMSLLTYPQLRSLKGMARLLANVISPMRFN